MYVPSPGTRTKLGSQGGQLHGDPCLISLSAFQTGAESQGTVRGSMSASTVVHTGPLGLSPEKHWVLPYSLHLGGTWWEHRAMVDWQAQGSQWMPGLTVPRALQSHSSAYCPVLETPESASTQCPPSPAYQPGAAWGVTPPSDSCHSELPACALKETTKKMGSCSSVARVLSQLPQGLAFISSTMENRHGDTCLSPQHLGDRSGAQGQP